MRPNHNGRHDLRNDDRDDRRRNHDLHDPEPFPDMDEDTDSQSHIETPKPKPAHTPPTVEKETTQVIEQRISEDKLAREGFTSNIPWQDLPADVVVVCCSDQRFEDQNRQFLSALGFKSPHFIQIPSGLAVFHTLIAAVGFLPKAMELLLDKAVDLTGVKDVICIAHHDCGGYKLGRFQILGKMSKRLTGKDLRDVQIEHLHQATRSIQLRLGSDTNVRAFYSDVIGQEGNQRVKFHEIDVVSRKLRKEKTA